MVTTSRFPAGREATAVRIAIARGARDANVLTNLVFHGRHPARLGRMLHPAEHALLREWYAIRRDLVGPLLGGQGPLGRSPYPPARRPWWLAPDPIVALEAEWEHWRSKAERAKTPKSARKQYDAARRDLRMLRKLPSAKGQDKHHKVELVVLKGYPGVFTAADLNTRLSSAVNVDATFHRSQLRRFWNRVYKDLDAEIKRRRLKRGSDAYKALVKTTITRARVRADALIRDNVRGKPALAR